MGPGSRFACPGRRGERREATFSRRDASELFDQTALIETRGRRECRVPAAPMVRVQQKSTRQNHRFSRNNRHSLRNGFNGLYVVSPVNRAFLPPSPARCGRIFADLAPASGRQDHTAWPSAMTSFVRALRLSTIFSEV